MTDTLERPHVTSKRVYEVLAAHERALLALPGVVGTAIGRHTDGMPFIRVMVERDRPATRARIPGRLGDYDVRVEVTGRYSIRWSAPEWLSSVRRAVFTVRRPGVLGLTAAAAVVYGLVILYGGAGHTIAVVGGALNRPRAWDFRFVALVSNGMILMNAALTNLILSRWIARGERWAFAWTLAATAFLAIYAGLLLPLEAARDAAGPAFVLSIVQVAALIIAWVLIREQPSRVTAERKTP